MVCKSFKYIINTSIIFIFIILNGVLSTNVIIIGDSRACEIGQKVLGLEYSTIINNGGKGSRMVTKSPKTFNDNNYQIVAEVGASFTEYLNEESEIYKSVRNVLSKAEKGTKVLLWLGINSLSASNAFKCYYYLAVDFPDLFFYAVSVPGVSPKNTKIKEDSLRMFNCNLDTLVSGTGPLNLEYRSILKSNDPNNILNWKTKKIYNINEKNINEEGGIHYTTEGYEFILNAMLSVLDNDYKPDACTCGACTDYDEKNTYTLAPGDTLLEIANRYATTVEKIKELNKIEGNSYHPGDVLRIPKFIE